MQPASIRRVTALETGTTLAWLAFAWFRARALVFGASGFAFSAFGAAFGAGLGAFLAAFFIAFLGAALVAAGAFGFFAVAFFGADLAAAFEAIQINRHQLGSS